MNGMIDRSIWPRVPELDGCFSSGDTTNEAKENVKDAIALYLEDFKEEGRPIPQPSIFDAELAAV